MKKFLVKYWGLVLAVVLLSSLFVGAAPVSAGTLSFTAAPNPNAVVGGITSAAVVNDYKVANDGTTIYAATSVGVLKSVNGGKSWGLPAVPAGLTTTDLIAVAPDNPNFVVAMDTVGGGATSNVSLSVNGGVTWSNLGPPRSATSVLNAAVTGIDVSPTIGGVNYIAVSGQTAGAPSLFYFAYGLTIPAWTDATVDAGWTAPAGWATSTIANAVKFSPNFAADYIALVVTDDNAATEYYLNSVSFNVFKWNAAIPTFVGYPAVIKSTVTPGSAIAKAEIAIDPLYYGGDSNSRIAYVGLTAGTLADANVYAMIDAAAGAIKLAATGVQVNSISLNSDGTKLFVGTVANNNVVTITNPSSAFATTANTRTSKMIGLDDAAGGGADNVVVRSSGANLFASKQNITGMFALSTDNGLTFNGISLVRCTATSIADQAVSADAAKRYVILADGTNSFIFYNDGTSWVCTYVLLGVNFILAPSPVNFDTLYIGQGAGGLAIYYTATAGLTNWYTRAAPGTGAVADIAVLNDSTIYTLATGGQCAKSATNGFIWTAATAPVAAGFDLFLVAEDQLVASSNIGTVAYTTTNGVPWTAIVPAVGVGATRVTADGLATGNCIYAVSAADINIYRWTIGTNTTAWTAGALAGAGFFGNGITLANGTLYAMYTNAADTQLWRSLVPNAIVAVYTGATTVGTPVLGGATAGNVGPNALKATNGNQLWFANSFAATFNVITYTDTLADPANVPPLVSPASGSLVQVNMETGNAYPVTLVFGDASLATAYQVEIAWDDQFTNMAIAAINVPFAPGPATQFVMVGPGTANVIPYQPGQTLYWRVRATAPFFSGYSDVWSFSIMPAKAVVAELSSPVNGATINSLTPGFSWSPLGGITSYTFQLAESPDFATTLYSTTTTSAGAAIPSTVKLVRGNTYYWRVKALTPTEGEWSTVGNFVVAELVKTTTPPPTQPAVTPTLTVVLPTPVTTQVIITQEAPPPDTVVNPSYIWAIIIIGAVLVIAVIVLIVRTRRSV